MLFTSFSVVYSIPNVFGSNVQMYPNVSKWSMVERKWSLLNYSAFNWAFNGRLVRLSKMAYFCNQCHVIFAFQFSDIFPKYIVQIYFSNTYLRYISQIYVSKIVFRYNYQIYLSNIFIKYIDQIISVFTLFQKKKNTNTWKSPWSSIVKTKM